MMVGQGVTAIEAVCACVDVDITLQAVLSVGDGRCRVTEGPKSSCWLGSE